MTLIFKRVNVRGKYRIYGFKDGKLFMNQQWKRGMIETLRKANQITKIVPKKLWKIEIMKGFVFYSTKDRNQSPEYRQVRYTKYQLDKPSGDDIRAVRKAVQNDWERLMRELNKSIAEDFGGHYFRGYVDETSAEEIRQVDSDELRGAKIGQLIKYSQRVGNLGESEAWRRIK